MLFRSITVINREDYEKMTGEKIDLADDETLVYGKNISWGWMTAANAALDGVNVKTRFFKHG